MFRVSAIRVLPECGENLCKILESNKYYLFDDSCVVDGDTIRINHQSKVPNGFFGNNINVQAIVGTNGSGKSSVLEILYRILNNMSCLMLAGMERPAAEQLYYIYGLFAELYYVYADDTDTFHLGCIKCEGIKTTLFEDGESVHEYVYPSKGTIDKQIERTFYNIVTNYSLQAFISEDYICEGCCDPTTTKHYEPREDKSWINGLFHKNDGYVTPITLNLYRNHGNINMSKEHRLATSRLSSILVYADLNGIEYLNGYRLDDITYEFNQRSIEDKYIRQLKQESISESKAQSDYIWNFDYKGRMAEIFLEAYDVKDVDDDSDIMRYAFLYLIYKTWNIAYTYPQYHDYYGFIKLKDILSPRGDTALEDKTTNLVKKILSDSSHITLKIRQTLCYFQICRERVNIKGKRNFNIKEYLLFKKRDSIHSMDDIMPCLAPSFFSPNITLRRVGENQSIILGRLSTGERQMMYLTSTMIYHALNIISAQGQDRIAYRRINFVIDEVEICFHPEYQRLFIHNLIRWFEAMGINKRLDINIMIATHSPFVLSDIPSSNIMYLADGRQCKNKDFINPFCANISDILYQSFFLKNGFVGEFARMKIMDAMKSNKLLSSEQRNKITQLIELIDEPMIKEHLKSYYFNHIEQ